MVDMTDPIVDRTVCQLKGYGLHNYVRRVTSTTSSQTVSLLLLGYSKDEFTALMTVPCHPALSLFHSHTIPDSA